MKQNTQESIDYDNQLVAELIATNPALVLVGAAMEQNRTFMAGDILRASGLENFANDVIHSSVNMHGYMPVTLAYKAHKMTNKVGI